jgi:hypothetical protein
MPDVCCPAKAPGFFLQKLARICNPRSWRGFARSWRGFVIRAIYNPHAGCLLPEAGADL